MLAKSLARPTKLDEDAVQDHYAIIQLAMSQP